MSLRVERLSLRYATGVQVLEDVSLEVAPGEFVSVVGPSGCGKSTLLNVVAGLVDCRLDVDRSGRVTWNGREIRTAADWAGGLGYVFQRDTLLPWFTLQQNVELGLRIRGVGRDRREERVRKLVRMVGLEGFEHVFPHQLSGGCDNGRSYCGRWRTSRRSFSWTSPLGLWTRTRGWGCSGK